VQAEKVGRAAAAGCCRAWRAAAQRGPPAPVVMSAGTFVPEHFIKMFLEAHANDYEALSWQADSALQLLPPSLQSACACLLAGTAAASEAA